MALCLVSGLVVFFALVFLKFWSFPVIHVFCICKYEMLLEFTTDYHFQGVEEYKMVTVAGKGDDLQGNK